MHHLTLVAHTLTTSAHLVFRLGGVEDAVKQCVSLPSCLCGIGLEKEEDHKPPKEVLLGEEGHELSSQLERHLRVLCSVRVVSERMNIVCAS